MKRYIALTIALLFALPVFAAGPVQWYRNGTTVSPLFTNDDVQLNKRLFVGPSYGLTDFGAIITGQNYGFLAETTVGGSNIQCTFVDSQSYAIVPGTDGGVAYNCANLLPGGYGMQMLAERNYFSGKLGIGAFNLDIGPTYPLDVIGLGHFTGLVDADHFIATSTTATSSLPHLSTTVQSLGNYYVDDSDGYYTIHAGSAVSSGGLRVIGFPLSNPFQTVIRPAFDVVFGYQTAGFALGTLGEADAWDIAIPTTSAADTTKKNDLVFTDIALGGETMRLRTRFDFVGIGTTTPTSRLSVSSIVGTTSPLFDVASTTNETLFKVLANGQISIGSTTPWAKLSINPLVADGAMPSFTIGSSTATKFVVTNAGRIGIGTSSPTLPLSVGDDGTYSAYFSGRVGIGTNAPSKKFVVMGGSQLIQNAGLVDLTLNDSTSNEIPTIYLQQGGVTQGKIEGGVGVTPGLFLGNGSSRLMSFGYIGNFLTVAIGRNYVSAVVGANAPNDGLVVQGSTGIGTTTPFSKLQVTSGAGATTTSTFGDISVTSSHACFNTKNTVGADISFYFVGTGMIVENNLCK
ncbi:MAG: hypothetical protein KW793_03480 [Candidatus Doudnabacteria bacterium]|nr:hypothetical protein [Candidatus Doudnabacteria bacterium]